MNLKNKKSSFYGFTLLEMLLVLAISSSLILLLINFASQKMEEQKRDKTVLQMQQILNAAMSYYVNNSDWPKSDETATCSSLGWQELSSITTNDFNKNYLYGVSSNPYGQPYYVRCTDQSSDSGGNFYVASETNKASDALTIAGKLPMAFINDERETTQTQTNCASVGTFDDCKTAIAAVNIPGQNLNNARSVNFMGLYYSGSCVPAPSCPEGMKPEIIVAPAAIAGVNDDPTNCKDTYNPNACDINIYPISSFSAYARGMNDEGDPGLPGASGSSSESPRACDLSTNSGKFCVESDANAETSNNAAFQTMSSGIASTTKYWRVCLSVITEKGEVTVSNGSDTNWRQKGKAKGQISAFTRCVPANGNEVPAGSSSVFDIFGD